MNMDGSVDYLLSAPSDIADGSAGKHTGPPSLYTQGNKIMNSQTGQPVVLKGIVTDHFRYNLNQDYPAVYGGLKAEIEKIERLKQRGADINIIGLYLSRLDKIKPNINELDRFINYARDNDIYIYFAPTGNAFRETEAQDMINANKTGFYKIQGQNDLAELTELLASRYGKYSNVLYQLTAEPHIPPADWEVKQKELAAIVRKHTNNLIIVSTSYYTPYSSLPVLPYGNIIYSTGGYISKNDSSFAERSYNQILGNANLRQNYPVIIAEFGGNYGGDFSSDRDLFLFKDILEEIGRAHLSYTIYRLSSAFKNDGLALFDTGGKLTRKGEIFVNFFIHR